MAGSKESNADTSKVTDELARLEAQEEHRSRTRLWVSRLTTSAALIAGVIAAIMATILPQGFTRTPGLEIQLLRQIEELQALNEANHSSISNLESGFRALSNPDTTSDALVQISVVKAEVSSVRQRLDIVDKAIVENPAKALSIPLLRQDLENLKSDYQDNRAEAAKQIDRVYDQNKWFIGLMFTMAIGLIGLAISNFIQARKP